MNINEKDVKKLFAVGSVIILLILVFLLIRPIILPIITGLILAYIFYPLYKRINIYVKNKTLAASLVCAIIILVIILVLIFSIPLILKQVSGIFLYSQDIDMQKVVSAVFPAASEQFIFQTTISTEKFIENVITGVRKSLIDFAFDLPTIVLNLFIMSFVFFFSLRDSERLQAFARGISPLSEAKEKVVVNHFKDVTAAVIYGQIIVGIIQGLLAGLGFWIFGVKNALVLTVLAVFFSIIPFIGPGLVWVPVAIYLFTTSSGIAVGFLLYNLLIVSVVDNILRSYLVSRKTKLSPAVVLIGMLGGIIPFGIIGLIIGPLLLAYLITLLEAYKDKTLYSLFSDKS